MKNVDVDRMQRRGTMYWLEDGIWELALGILFVLYAGYYGTVAALPADSGIRIGMSVGYVVVIPGGMFALSMVVKRLKALVTVPRTGYVSFNKGPRRRIRSAIVGAAVAIVAFLGMELVDLLYMPVLIAGLGLALGLGITGHKIGLPRFIVVGGIGLATAIVLSLITDVPEIAFSVLFGSVGLIVSVTGAVVFRRYLRTNPMPQDYSEVQ